MKTTRVMFIATAVAGTLAVGGWRLLLAQTKESVDPDSLLSPQTSLYLRFAGSERTQESFQKTAAYKALQESGLVETISPLLQKAIDLAVEEGNAIPPDAKPIVQLVRRTAEHLQKHGLTVGADIRLLGDIVVVLPKAGEAGLAKEWNTIVRGLAEQEGLKIADREIENRKASVLTVPGAMISWWEEGVDLVLAANMVGPDTVIMRAAGKSPSLIGSDKLKRMRPERAFPLAAEFWADSESLMGQIPPIPPVPQVLHATGVTGVRGLRMTVGYEGKAVRTDYDLLLGAARTGYLKLLEAPPLRCEELPKIPADTQAMFAFSLDGKHLVDNAYEVTKSILSIDMLRNQLGMQGASEQFDKQLDEMSREIGFHVGDELIATLGPFGLVYLSPLDGPLGIGGITMVVGVKDKDRLHQTLEILVERLAQEDQQVIVERTNHLGAKLWIGGYREPGFPLTPTFALTDKWLIVNPISPAPVMRLLKLQQGKGNVWEPPANLAKLIDANKTSLVAVSYLDPKPLARLALSTVPILAGMARNALPELEIDMTRLPDTGRIVDNLFPSAGIVTADESGLHGTDVSSLPLLGPAIGEGLFALGVANTVAIPRMLFSRDAANQSRAMNNLKMQGLAVHNYHDTFTTVPRGTVKQAAQLKTEDRLSWFASTLPFVEQQAAYQNLAFDEPWNSPKNRAVTNRPLNVFRNPALNRRGGPANTTHFVGVAGVGKGAAKLKVTDKNAGIFGYDRDVRFQDVRDGLSKTMLVISVEQNLGPWAQGGQSTIRGLSQRPYYQGPDGFGGHKKGSIVLMADGSVQLINKNIDPRVFEAMATINNRD